MAAVLNAVTPIQLITLSVSLTAAIVATLVLLGLLSATVLGTVIVVGIAVISAKLWISVRDQIGG